MPSTAFPTARMATASTTTRAPCCLRAALGNDGEARLPEMLTTRFAAFIQHAWNPDTQRFRNFMSYDRVARRVGSEDSHGRTLWALGECAATDTDRIAPQLGASTCSRQHLPPVEDFSSPRAWAFTLLGLDAYCATIPDDVAADRLRHVLADRLMALLARQHGAIWHWFENVLAYDNARLPQALIETGLPPARTPISRLA